MFFYVIEFPNQNSVQDYMHSITKNKYHRQKIVMAQKTIGAQVEGNQRSEAI